MKHILIVFAVFLFSLPVQAEETQDLEVARRLELARQMHELWPVRTRVEEALDILSEQIQPDKQLEFKAAMRKAIQFNELEAESVKAMADTFTTEELEAMVAFYGSKAGRSVSAKTKDYQLALQPIMTRMMDAALMDLKTGGAQ